MFTVNELKILRLCCMDDITLERSLKSSFSLISFLPDPRSAFCVTATGSSRPRLPRVVWGLFSLFVPQIGTQSRPSAPPCLEDVVSMNTFYPAHCTLCTLSWFERGTPGQNVYFRQSCTFNFVVCGHMTSVHLSILERDPPLLLSWRVLPFFPLWNHLFLFFGSFSWSDVRSKVRDVVCVRKALWGKLVICGIGLHKIIYS